LKNIFARRSSRPCFQDPHSSTPASTTIILQAYRTFSLFFLSSYVSLNRSQATLPRKLTTRARYPLFCTELQTDGSFTWVAPFHPDVPLPWLDAEHDVGPAVLQIFKDGVKKWGEGAKIPLAYEMLSPREACRVFAKGVGRPVRYRREAKIEVKVKIPNGYREQLIALEEMYALGARDKGLQPPYFADTELEEQVPEIAMGLWEGYRGLEEYAREVFPLEEAANGLTWMNDENDEEGEMQGGEEEGGEGQDEDDEDEEGLVIGGGIGSGTATGDTTPARREETWLA
jgi:hypothetical protein